MGSRWIAPDAADDLNDEWIAQADQAKTNLAPDDIAGRDQVLDRPEFDDLRREARDVSAPRDPYRGEASLLAVMSELIRQGEIEPQHMRDEFWFWSDICDEAPFFSGEAHAMLQMAGSAQDTVRQLEVFCNELTAWEEERQPEGDQALEWEPRDLFGEYFDVKEREGQDAALRRALEVITYSRSEAQIFSALLYVIHSGALDSPFPGVSSNSLQLVWQGKVLVAAYSAVLCDNLGGCSANHPLVLRYCLIPDFQPACYHPRDIYHAIEQSLTPIQHILFWSLLNQIDALRRRYL